jgi:hypothetical protein
MSTEQEQCAIQIREIPIICCLQTQMVHFRLDGKLKLRHNREILASNEEFSFYIEGMCLLLERGGRIHFFVSRNCSTHLFLTSLHFISLGGVF